MFTEPQDRDLFTVRTPEEALERLFSEGVVSERLFSNSTRGFLGHKRDCRQCGEDMVCRDPRDVRTAGEDARLKWKCEFGCDGEETATLVESTPTTWRQLFAWITCGEDALLRAETLVGEIFHARGRVVWVDLDPLAVEKRRQLTSLNGPRLELARLGFAHGKRADFSFHLLGVPDLTVIG
jgi:hypothetical protein